MITYKEYYDLNFEIIRYIEIFKTGKYKLILDEFNKKIENDNIFYVNEKTEDFTQFSVLTSPLSKTTFYTLKDFIPLKMKWFKINNQVYIDVEMTNNDGKLYFKYDNKIDYFEYINQMFEKIDYSFKNYIVLDNDIGNRTITLEIDTLFESILQISKMSENKISIISLGNDYIIEANRVIINNTLITIYYKEKYTIDDRIKRMQKIEKFNKEISND